jgi:hypothetical protein
MDEAVPETQPRQEGSPAERARTSARECASPAELARTSTRERTRASAGAMTVAHMTQIGPSWAQIGPTPPRKLRALPAPLPVAAGTPAPAPRRLHRRVTSGRRRDDPPPSSPWGSREALSPAAPFIGVDRLSRRRPLGVTRSGAWAGDGGD